MSVLTNAIKLAYGTGTQAPGALVSEQRILQDDFDNDVDALLEEGLCAPKKRRMEEKYGGDSDHPSDGETSVQPMMTKIKTVLKSKSASQKVVCLWGGRSAGLRALGCQAVVWAVGTCLQEDSHMG